MSLRPELELAPGTLLADRYRIESPIARGGMGAVLRATDVRLGRAVAVKVLLPALADDLEAVQRFQREATAAARVAHPGIVGVLDLGTAAHPSGRGHLAYLVMELLEGESLAAMSARGPMDPALVTELGIQALDALQAAHDAGLVHRDLKPANLVVVQTSSGPRVRLVDFGLVQIKDGSVHTRLTQTGVIMGTPLYMSPEQARAESCDARTDVYALGLVLWSCLTGRLPSQATDMASAILSVLVDVPPRADVVVAGVPTPLGEVIAHAIEKDPARRPASARAFASALESTRARATPPTPPTPPRATSHGLVGLGVALVSLVALGVLAAAAVGLWFLFDNVAVPNERASVAHRDHAVPTTVALDASVADPQGAEIVFADDEQPPTSGVTPATRHRREPHEPLAVSTPVAPTTAPADPPSTAPPATIWEPPEGAYIPECRTMLTCCRGFSIHAPCNNVYEGVPQSHLAAGCLAVARDFRDRIAAEGRHVEGCDP